MSITLTLDPYKYITDLSDAIQNVGQSFESGLSFLRLQRKKRRSATFHNFSEMISSKSLPRFLSGNDKKRASSYITYTRQQEVQSLPVTVAFDTKFSSLVTFPKITKISRIALSALEFPNTTNGIGENNNEIQWINLEDEEANYPIYSAKVTPYAYTQDQLTNSLVEEMNKVKRRNGSYHYFSVNTSVGAMSSEFQNEITFQSLTFSQIGIEKNPISTIADNNLITISQRSHNLVVGKYIIIKGVDGDIGGVPVNSFNGAFVVDSIIDENKFRVKLTITPYLSEVGGGEKVWIGQLDKFMFLTHSKSILPFLGFPKCNSANSISLENEMSLLADTDDNKLVLHIPKHNLKRNDEFSLYGIQTAFLQKPLVVLDVIDSDHVSIKSENYDIEADAKAMPVDSNNRMLISSIDAKIGFAEYQSNMYSNGLNKVPYNALNTIGDTYIYLVCPQLDNAETWINCPKGTLARIQLTLAFGNIIFNSHSVQPISFLSGTGPTLESLELQLRTADDKLIQLRGIDFSGLLQISREV